MNWTVKDFEVYGVSRVYTANGYVIVELDNGIKVKVKTW